MNDNLLPTMTPAEREEYLEMLSEQSDGLPMSLLDDFEDCLLYYHEDDEGNLHAVYCYEDLVESWAKKNHSTYTEAVEWVDYNTMRTIPYMTHVGDQPTGKPIIVHRINQGFTTLEPSYYEKQYSDD
jgi:hypothetical protein